MLAPDEFRNTLQSFISWKKQQGFLVIEAYTSQIGSDTTSIRNYLRNLYNDQSTPTPDYLLICGDTPKYQHLKVDMVDTTLTILICIMQITLQTLYQMFSLVECQQEIQTHWQVS